MRMIGHIQKESDAQTLSDYLYVKGIKNQLEPEKDGSAAIWIYGEDEIGPAKEIYQRFVQNPSNPEYQQVAKQAEKLRNEEKEQEEAAARRYHDSSEVFKNYAAYGMGPVTKILIAVSVVVWLLFTFGRENRSLEELISSLMISELLNVRTLPEVREGQIWRLFTPMIIHSPTMPLHILFNMLWLKDLGSMIEARQNSLFFIAMVAVISAVSNMAQYFVSGPMFFGMSGVVYGLFGYVWIKGKLDPASGYFMHPTTVIFMMVWFVIGFTGFLNMANTVHGVGLLVGVIWGVLGSLKPLSSR